MYKEQAFLHVGDWDRFPGVEAEGFVAGEPVTKPLILILGL